MTRAEYIEAVKAKLEEISPFEEPTSFIALEAGDADQGKVKPIVSYIDKTLDEATRNCLRALPLTLLHADIARTQPTLTIAADGVASFDITANKRFVRFRHPDLKRDITAFISTEDPIYLLQQNVYTRGGLAKPIAVVSSDVASGVGKMEIYTLKHDSETNTAYLLSIDLNKKTGSDDTNPVLSPISDLIVLECAAMVADILGNTNTATVCRNEQAMKIQATLQ